VREEERCVKIWLNCNQIVEGGFQRRPTPHPLSHGPMKLPVPFELKPVLSWTVWASAKLGC
jgi:hypothetical protein